MQLITKIKAKIHTERPNKMQKCIKIYYTIFIWIPTCFGRHTAHHQKSKTALTHSGFAYVEGCWTCGCWTLSGRVRRRPATTCPTCWAIYKYGI